MPDLSVVLPVFNEAGCLRKLHDEIVVVLDSHPSKTAEIIYVDDGSVDDSLQVLRQIQSEDDRVVVLEFTRNFGQTAALYAGFQASSGHTVVAMDADGQNNPHDIFRLVDCLEEGFDCVSGWRVNRQDKGLTRRFPARVANWLISKVSGLDIHDSGCTLKAYDGPLIRSIPLYGEMHRLIPYYVYLAGGRVTEREVDHRVRSAGASKYGLGRTFRVIQDLAVAKVQADFAVRPMHLFGTFGGLLGIGGVTFISIAILLKLLGVRDLVETPLLIIASVLLLAGLQLILFGLLAEIILRRMNLDPSNLFYRVRNPRENVD